MSVKIFSGRSSRYLAEKIVKRFYDDDDITKLNEVSITTFNDGELGIRYLESIRSDNVFIIQSTVPPGDNFMELFLMLDAAKRSSARRITAVIPYFGYARQDRKDKPRVPISAKLMADLLTTAGATRIVTVDLHADQIQGFFNIPVDHLSASYAFIPYLRDKMSLDNLIIASPDVGGTKRASRFSTALDVDMAIVHKERASAGVISSMKLIGDVEGKDVVLIDDIIDTAGSICKAAKLMMDNGAKSVRALCTHPLLSNEAYDNINKSLLTEVIVSDTIPVKRGESEKIKIISVDKMIAKAMKRIIDGKSLSVDLTGSM
jgi:ribose-phosphate pyrophosphokinase